MKVKILKLLEENIGKHLCNLGVEEREFGKHFLDTTQKALSIETNKNPAVNKLSVQRNLKHSHKKETTEYMQ